MPYEFQSRIRYSEVGEDRKLTLPGMINYFQDCSTFQSEDIGNGVEEMNRIHRAWVLAYWQISLLRMPTLGERVTIQTWGHSMKGFQGGRNFQMLDEAGEMLSCANSLWIFLDTQTGHPVKINPEVLERYPLEPPLPMEKTSRKIRVPEHAQTLEGFEVKQHHLDTNHHVNNAQYIAMTQDYLEKGAMVTGIRVEYRRAAVLGDRICPLVAREDNRTTICLADTEGQAYAVLEYTMIQTAKGQSPCRACTKMGT